MPEPLAYLNGRFVRQDEARLPLHDAGFVSGAAVVDFSRTFRHRLFRWPDHLARLRHDCAACQIPLAATDAELTTLAQDLVAHNALLLSAGQELALITFATPGPMAHYIAGDGLPTLGLHTFVLPLERYRRFFAEGVTLVVPGHQPADPTALVSPRVKHRSRLHWWIADRQARAAGPPGAVALLTDGPGGPVTETALGNFLIVKDGTVRTPPRDRVLDGVSLRVVAELCRDLGVPLVEQMLSLDDCAAADEAMLCGTAFCLAGVRSVAGRPLPWPGPLTQRLLAAFSLKVGVDIAAQMG
jgi:branched-chain amino acid aminotransferase